MNNYERLMSRGLKGCDWYRIRCGACGDYDAQLEAGSAVLPRNCHHCTRPVAIVHQARGVTKGSLPFIGKPVKPQQMFNPEMPPDDDRDS